MPGLIGVIASTASNSEAPFAKARTRMLRHRRMTAQEVSAPSGQWRTGRVRLSHTGDPEQARQPDTPVAFLHGDLHNRDEIASRLGLSPGIAVERLLAELYRRDGGRFVDHLEGAFCVSLVDTASRQLFIATDLFGSFPIYWHAGSAGFVYSSDLSAVLAALPSPPRMDIRAVADYVTLGAVLEDRTLAKDVHLLDPGTVLRYDAETGLVTIRRYDDVATLFARKATNKTEYLEAVCTTFRQAVDRCLIDGAPLGLSLSGGLDSRAILSAINGRAATVRTYTLGVDGCADHVIADQLAALAGTRHEFFELDASYLRDFLPNLAAMVSATDGMYLSHGLTEMLALQFIDRLGLKVLLRGHGGELAKAHLAWPLHTDPQVYTFRSLEQLVPYLSRRANYVTPNLALGDLFTPDAVRAAGGGSAESFRSVLRGTNLSPVEACSYLYLRELSRRFTVPSLELFRTQVDVRMPYVDRQFLRVLLAAPPEWRDSTEIHTALTLAGIPKLAQVRNSNTGAPGDAGRLTEAIWDKFNTLFKRMNLRGFRHYHNFDGWMRSMLLQSVEEELLPSSARIHGFVRRDALQRIIQETRSGAGDHGYLLQVLLILELWQREHGIELGTV